MLVVEPALLFIYLNFRNNEGFSLEGNNKKM